MKSFSIFLATLSMTTAVFAIGPRPEFTQLQQDLCKEKIKKVFIATTFKMDGTKIKKIEIKRDVTAGESLSYNFLRIYTFNACSPSLDWKEDAISAKFLVTPDNESNICDIKSMTITKNESGECSLTE